MNPHHRCEPPPEFLERFSPEPRDLELGTAEVLTSSHSGKRRTDEDIRRKVVALTSDHGEEFRDPLIVPRSR